jgi:hypothetical protein
MTARGLPKKIASDSFGSPLTVSQPVSIPNRDKCTIYRAFQGFTWPNPPLFANPGENGRPYKFSIRADKLASDVPFFRLIAAPHP